MNFLYKKVPPVNSIALFISFLSSSDIFFVPIPKTVIFLFLLIFAASCKLTVAVPCKALSVENIIVLLLFSSKLEKLYTQDASPSPIMELPFSSFPINVPLLI